MRLFHAPVFTVALTFVLFTSEVWAEQPQGQTILQKLRSKLPGAPGEVNAGNDGDSGDGNQAKPGLLRRILPRRGSKAETNTPEQQTTDNSGAKPGLLRNMLSRKGTKAETNTPTQQTTGTQANGASSTNNNGQNPTAAGQSNSGTKAKYRFSVDHLQGKPDPSLPAQQDTTKSKAAGGIVSRLTKRPSNTDQKPPEAHEYVKHIKGTGSGFGQNVDDWNTDKYTVTRTFTRENGKCKEDITIKWKDGGRKTFTTDCLKKDASRPAIHEHYLLLIGKPGDSFCVYSCRKNEYYYKINKKWKKGTVDGDEVDFTDVSTLTTRIDKWQSVAQKYENNIHAIATRQGEEKKKYAVTLKELDEKKKIEDKKFEQDISKILERRKTEYVRQVKADIESKIELLSHAQNKENIKNKDDINKDATAKEAELRNLESEKQHEYQSKLMSIEKTIADEKNKHDQANHNFVKQYDDEKTRFNKEYEDLIGKGL